ncbi:MAG: hypothetical protein DRN66_03525 [Candidatus Nanohalarchaeota archaeon]|nr:MAG: hypothetical protein DRN66_03525 [Candidatus Nanohaloarchaeota archaeon]
MVYSRTKIVLMDYIFGNEMEHRDISLSYEGKNPFELYKKIISSFNDIFAVPNGRVHESNYTVNNKKDKIDFGAGWTIIKQMDIYSYLRFDIALSGEEAKETKTGSAKVVLKPKIYTEYPQDNIIQQNVFYEMARRIWHEAIYENTRDKFILEGKEISNNFTSYIRTCFLTLNK